MVNRSKSSINYTTIKNTKEYYYGFGEKVAKAANDNSQANSSTCLSNGTEVSCYSGIVCEGNSTQIACQENSNIISGTIKYGRWENQVCKGQFIPAGPNSKNYSIPTSCIGKNSCTIDKNALTEDPLPGISKEFQVTLSEPRAGITIYLENTGGMLDSNRAVTNPDGVASFTLTSGSLPTSFKLKAGFKYFSGLIDIPVTVS